MSGLVLGVEIGGTKLQAALGRRDGTILARRRGSAPAGADAKGILAWFPGPMRELIAEAGKHGGRVEGVGVGFGGPIDTPRGTTVKSHQVSGWDDFPLRDWFAGETKLPAAVINDSNAAGWAEYRCGSGRGTRTFCYMNVGSGIGGALVLDGRLHDGQGLGAWEMGHTRISEIAGGALRQTKLEDLCSGWAIERAIRAQPPKPGTPLYAACGGDASKLTCGMLGDAAQQGDAEAQRLIDIVAERLARAMANAVTLVHPERFALGGGVSLLGEVLLDPLRRYVNDYVFEPYRGWYEIVPAALGEDVVLVGALLLAGG